MSAEPTIDVEATLDRLERDGIEHLWVIYHDYSGRAMAKTVPRSSFRTALRDGVVFALANLNMDILDHQPPNATLLANTGDFLAVPDPRSYARVPQVPKTARMHTWMRATDGSAWQGCPRTRLDQMAAELARAGYRAQCAFEPEFYLLAKAADGEYTPVNATRMMTRDGLAVEADLVRRIMQDLEVMGIRVPQLGRSTARASLRSPPTTGRRSRRSTTICRSRKSFATRPARSATWPRSCPRSTPTGPGAACTST
ncbi:MAG: hypothetical protein QJR03_11485 [Sphaerobacter sp.]|nr:hypothetical protein [Sphaerobacter sp.]